MDAEKFMQLYLSSREEDPFTAAKKRVRESLERDADLGFYDMLGDGTHYRCLGLRHGVGYAFCDVTVCEDGCVTIRIECMPVPEACREDLMRLCDIWNSTFVLKGLDVEDGMLVFFTRLYCPGMDDVDCSRAVHLAYATIRMHASATLALEAGAMPWELIGIADGYRDGSGDDGCDGPDGAEAEPKRDDLDPIERRTRALRSI